jgi:hypothetical protein
MVSSGFDTRAANGALFRIGRKVSTKKFGFAA